MSDAQDKRDYQELYNEYNKAQAVHDVVQSEQSKRELSKARATLNLFARRNGFI